MHQTRTRAKIYGFTLVEIMIVVAIVAILAAITIPQLLESRKMSKLSRCLSNLKIDEYAKEQYALNRGLASGYSMDTAEIVEMAGFLKNGWGSDALDCPSGGSLTYWIVGTPCSCDYHGTVSAPSSLSALTND